jgi:hypothetical protein
MQLASLPNLLDEASAAALFSLPEQNSNFYHLLTVTRISKPSSSTPQREREREREEREREREREREKLPIVNCCSSTIRHSFF